MTSGGVFFGAALAGTVWIARSTMEESPEFHRQVADQSIPDSPLRHSLAHHRGGIGRAFAISALGSITYYVGITYVPAFLTSAGSLSESASLWLSTAAAVIVILVTPFDSLKAAAQALYPWVPIGPFFQHEIDAVGALDDERQRGAGRGIAEAVAQERGEIDRLAGAIDAAFGIDKGIETGRRAPARHAAIGEIEGRRFQAEKCVIRLAVGCDQKRRRRTALAARQIGFELNVPVRIGALGRKHLIAARQQPHLDLALRFGAGERMHKGMDAVIAREGCQTKI